MNKKQIRSCFLLIFIIIIFQFINYYKPYISSASDDFMTADIAKKLDTLERQLAYKQPIKIKNKKEILSFFDPNKIGLKDWVDMGFSYKQAKAILKYKNIIGGFRKSQDLKKCYVISDDKYSYIAPYIKISNIKVKKINVIKKKDINLISIEDMKHLNIRKKIKNRVIKFRDKLGGFYTMQQINEVYEIRKNENMLFFKYFDVLERDNIKKISINQSSMEELVNHPYITREMAIYFINLRSRSSIKNINDLFILKKIRDKKLKKYLKL